MKLIILFLLSITTIAASITAQPFKFTLDTNNDEYDISMELTLACRYEKFVISDSSQYNIDFKDIPLKITKRKGRVTIENKSSVSHEVKGYFKSNKGCYSISNFIVSSKKYAVGWANQFSRPITLKLYESTRPQEYSDFDALKIIDLVANKEVGLIFKPVGNQVNIKLVFDGVEYESMSTFANSSALRYKNSDYPYPLRK